MSKKQNMAMVVQAFINAGLSENQAKILAAEVGRENSFQDKYLWGYHSDPHNKVTNVGIISWQGARGRKVEKFLQDRGLIKNGKMVKGQASLDAMAEFLVNEIRTTPAYASTKNVFLDNPNVSYSDGTRVLGRNFIRWRYDDPKYKHGHTHRDNFYRQLGGIVPQGGVAYEDTPTPSVGTTAPHEATTPTNPLSVAFPETKPLMKIDGLQTPTNLFGSDTTILSGMNGGLVLPDNKSENELFSKIADMSLDANTEGIYAELAKTISAIKEKTQTKPMLQYTNPIMTELGSIFDSIDIKI